MTFIEKLENAGIEINSTVVIGRNEDTQWIPMVLAGVHNTSLYPFSAHTPDGDTWGCEFIAPYKGNETAIYSEGPVYGMWDFDMLRETENHLKNWFEKETRLLCTAKKINASDSAILNSIRQNHEETRRRMNNG